MTASTRQSDIPPNFSRIWRIALTDAGYRDEYVELLGHAPDGKVIVRYQRDGLVESVTPHSLFPVMAGEQLELI